MGILGLWPRQPDSASVVTWPPFLSASLLCGCRTALRAHLENPRWSAHFTTLLLGCCSQVLGVGVGVGLSCGGHCLGCHTVTGGIGGLTPTGQGESRALVTSRESEKGNEHIRGSERKREEMGGLTNSIAKGGTGVLAVSMD